MYYGRIKSDEWYAGIDFEITVSIAKLFGCHLPPALAGVRVIGPVGRVVKPPKPDTPEGVIAIREYLLFEATMYLAIAIRYATEKVTSEEHATKYLHNMVCYLETIEILFPDFALLPNHHNALHLPEFLLRFGPANCWWMYPFERVIGRLQCLNENTHIGTSTASVKCLDY